MSAPRQKWFRGLQSSSLFRPAPQNANQKHTEVFAYVELFAQFVSESFVDDIGEAVRSHYPSQESCLLDDVLDEQIVSNAIPNAIKEQEATPPKVPKRFKKSTPTTVSPGERGPVLSPNPAAKFSKGDAVELRSVVDRSVVVPRGEVTGLSGEDRFHCVMIESPWVRVSVQAVYCGDAALPMPNKEEKQLCLRNVLGMNTLWNARFLRKC